MQPFPVCHRRILTAAAACAAFAFSSMAQASGLDALRDHDPASETTGPADAGFAASCRASARERLGGERFEFDRPAFAVRDGRQIVRMDLLTPGQRRNPDQILRAVCVREVAGQPVGAMVFDGPADGIGPRVVAIPGPTPEMRPRRIEPERLPIGPPPGVVYLPGYGGYGLPGLAIPDTPFWFRRDRAFADKRFDSAFPNRRFDKRSKPVIDGSRGATLRFAAPKAKSNTTRFGSPATTRMGTGAFIR